MMKKAIIILMMVLFSGFVMGSANSDLYNLCRIYYPMGESSSPLVDTTYADNDVNAVCNDSISYQKCPTFQQSGIIDYAPHFDGLSDSFKTESNVIMNTGDNPFTVNIWFNMDDYQKDQYIYGHHIGSYKFEIYWDYVSPSEKKFKVYDSWYDPVFSVKYVLTLSDNNLLTNYGEWHMITFVRRSISDFEIWLDAVDVTASQTQNVLLGQPSVGSSEFFIGGLGDNVSYFDGYLDEFSYYLTDLNESHIEYLYGNGFPDSDQQFNFSIGTSYFQCNDGLDNDLDGFTDYPDDPSCSGVTDNNEYPADDTSQEEDDCLVSLGCVIYDSIPYSDSPFLHDWYGGQESDAKTIGHLGGYSIDLDIVDEFDIKENVIIFIDNQNTNNYNTLHGRFRLSLLEEEGLSISVDNEPVYVGFLDSSDNGIAWVRINVTSDSPYDLRLDIYAYDGDHWELADYGWVDNSNYGYFNIEFYLDEGDDEYYLQITDFFGIHTTTAIFDYDNSSSGQVAKAMVTNTLDRAEAQVLLHLVELTGTDSGGVESTSCTSWDLPFHLKENFNGYMSQCDWNVYPDIFFYGEMTIENEIDNFMIYKLFDYSESEAIYYDRSRFATIKFDLIVYSDTDTNTTLNLYLYDLSFTNAFVRLFFKEDGDIDATVNKANINLYDSLTTDVSKEVMVVLDLFDDEFDLYYDGTVRESDIGFYDVGMNVQYFNGIYFESANSHYSINNLEVYESEGDGEELSAPTIIVIPSDATKPFCKLFRTEQPDCYSDSDCDTDKCLVNGKCSRFDNTYCEDKGYTRGNLCIMSAVSYCGLSSVGNMILKHFWLFLIFLIILMIFIYVVVIFRGK